MRSALPCSAYELDSCQCLDPQLSRGSADFIGKIHRAMGSGQSEASCCSLELSTLWLRLWTVCSECPIEGRFRSLPWQCDSCLLSLLLCGPEASWVTHPVSLISHPSPYGAWPFACEVTVVCVQTPEKSEWTSTAMGFEASFVA